MRARSRPEMSSQQWLTWMTRSCEQEGSLVACPDLPAQLLAVRGVVQSVASVPVKSAMSVRRVVKKAAQKATVRPYVAGSGRREPFEDPHLPTFDRFWMIRREDKHLEDIMLRLRHSSIQTTDQVYGHLRRH